eukprot:1145275-Pelagomonas_calceolata.AAC.5
MAMTLSCRCMQAEVYTGRNAACIKDSTASARIDIRKVRIIPLLLLGCSPKNRFLVGKYVEEEKRLARSYGYGAGFD